MRRLSRGQKIVLEKIQQLNDAGVKEISNATLAELTGLASTTVVAYLSQLERMGLVARAEVHHRTLTIA